MGVIDLNGIALDCPGFGSASEVLRPFSNLVQGVRMKKISKGKDDGPWIKGRYLFHTVNFQSRAFLSNKKPSTTGSSDACCLISNLHRKVKHTTVYVQVYIPD